MCDYSLQGIRNRLAEQGEILVVHRFQTGSKGLTSAQISAAGRQTKNLDGNSKAALRASCRGVRCLHS